MHCRITIFLLMLLLAIPPAGAALRCPDGLVDTGDLAVEVLDACGEPDFVDHWASSALAVDGLQPDVEQWTYNFGPDQLLYTLRLRGGRVQRIDADGYGFHPSPDEDCQPSAIAAGMSKYELLARCGRPVQRDALFVLRPLRGSARSRLHVRGRLRRVYRETWIYNFGDSRLLRRVTLENGRVVDVDAADSYGFD
ncbi:MAG: DUF2845 domain-containing protein [Salinisphaera sp.]|nr:DUF2845 domain-containing protein [Salinisphaera sp.]